MTDIAVWAKHLIGSLLNTVVSVFDHEARRTDKNTVFKTIEDFRRCPLGYPRMVVLGCTGAGKSTLLNVLAGNRFVQAANFAWRFTDPVLFRATHGCAAVTKAACYAAVDWFGDADRPLVIVDTPGHDDTEGKQLESKQSRDALREQAADLHNKLQALGSVNVILVLHSHVSSNRLNPATYMLLRMVQEKFGSSVWEHVVMGYSQCNQHLEAGWRADLPRKCAELQAEVREQIPECKVNVPVLAIGGGVMEDDYLTQPEFEDDFVRLWELVSITGPIDTSNIRPFEGAHWKQYERVVQRRDEAVARADAAVVYLSVLFKFGAFGLFLMWRSMLLPTWMSVLLMNVPSTIFDELLLAGLLVVLIGPTKFRYSSLFFYEQWISPHVHGMGSWVADVRASAAEND